MRVLLGDRPLSWDQLDAIRSGTAVLGLSPKARRRMGANLRALQSLQKGGKPIYGVNTGFGKLCQVFRPGRCAACRRTSFSHVVGWGLPRQR